MGRSVGLRRNNYKIKNDKKRKAFPKSTERAFRFLQGHEIFIKTLYNLRVSWYTICYDKQERMTAMTVKREFTYLSNDGKTNIHAVEWRPESGEIKAVLQIVHGMVEFIDRYEEFAQYLTERGFVVVGHDHLGHGASILSKKEYGFFSEKKGNAAVLKDIRHLKNLTEKRFGDLPYYMLGHSMGSFLLRQYLCLWGKKLDGAIIMGTGTKPVPVLKAGRGLCRGMAAIFGWRHRSILIDRMAFGGYNKHFKPARTTADWLTKDTKIVDRYLADERCTFRFTLNGYYNLFYSMEMASVKNNLTRMPKDLPVLFVSGREDPVGDFGTGVKLVKRRFQEAGMEKVTLKLYDTDRHEVLNETNRSAVYEDLYNWLSEELTHPRRKEKRGTGMGGLY